MSGGGMSPTGKSRSLAELVQIYRRMDAKTLDGTVQRFRGISSLEQAINIATSATDENDKIDRHQRRIGRAVLGRAAKQLLRHAEAIETCKSFEELHSCIGGIAGKIYRFGKLAVYDTSLRIGAKLGHLPDKVYLHAGTKQGYKAFTGERVSGHTVEMAELPYALQELEPHHAENFLCIYKKQIAEAHR